ncbi:MAG: type II secretion system protein [bacterium]
MKFKPKNDSGFTLVELLIVIVILGILAAIVIARFAGATQESKEASLKSNLRTMRNVLETYRGKSRSSIYPQDLDYLWDGSQIDVSFERFIERIPIEPFTRSRNWEYATLNLNDSPIDRDSVITGTGGWVYDSVNGRVCINHYSTDTSVGAPVDTSWGTAYNIW